MLKSPKKLVLLLGDLAVLHLALFLTLIIRYSRSDWNNQWERHWPEFWPIFFIWLLIFYINNLYNLNFAGGGEKFYRSFVNSVLVSTVLSVIYFYLNFVSPIAPKTNLAIFIVILSFIFYAWRRLYHFFLRGLIPSEKIAIIGSREKSDRLLEEISANPGAGYRADLIISPQENLSGLAEKITSHNIHTLVIAAEFGSSAVLEQLLNDCWHYNIAIFDYPDFYERLSGKIPLEAISPAWFLNNVQAGQKKYFHYFKHLNDWILAVFVFIISLPLWPLIALIIRLDGKEIFFKQTRLGRNGEKFILIKFRTMQPVAAQKNGSVLINEQNPISKQEIIWGGRFLRETRLDELPQLINILKGEMSFIGPRPETPEIASLREKQIPFYRLRLLVKPGLTGWDQISGTYHSASEEDSRSKLQHDLYYLKHRSLYLDLSIALKTLATIASRSGK